MDATDFPANLYVAEGLAGRGALERRLVESASDLRAALDDDVAVLSASHVHYRTGAVADLAALTAAAHEAGALVVWDLCHSAGVLPLALDEAGVDFAVGCGYKFLSGGPGAPAWIYVARRHLAAGAAQPLSGWMGHAAPFEFDPAYRGDPGIRRFLCGTPHILSMRALEAALAVFEGVAIEQVRAKAVGLTELFIRRVEAGLEPGTLELVSPRDPERRGAQASFAFEHGYAVVQALIARGVVGDYREPRVMRFGFSPLCLAYAEVARAADELVDCIRGRVWRDPAYTRRRRVT